jgi:hypothetical protein
MNFTYKQPYVTWKGPSTGSAVPAWSRPLINNNNGANTGTSFAARPIKHWRKQLVPAANSGISTNAGVGMPMDRPGGSVYLGSAVYLGATVDCSICPVNLAELIPTTKNTVFDTTKDASGNCVACNPETNIIKSAVTLLNKNYYSDTKGYLQSRCQTYDQKLSTTPIPGNSYINSTTHEPIPPSDSPTGSQVYYTENCSKKCTTNNSRVTTIYKPNNQQYSQQGAVDSSSRLTRLKYNTITKNGNSFKTAWGQQGANAGRYQGTSDAPYFLKSKYQVCVPQHRDGNKTTSCIQSEIRVFKKIDMTNASASASRSYLPTPPGEIPETPDKAIDGIIDTPETQANGTRTKWSAGAFPTQWIEIDLGEIKNVAKIRLQVSQFPSGTTIHQIYAGNTTNPSSLIHTFNQFTAGRDFLEYILPNTLNFRYLRVLTTSSPSWVAWWEIEFYSY